MIDDQKVLRDYLLTVSDVTDIVATRIYAGRDTPPEAWKPSVGACLVFKRRGNLFMDELNKTISASFQFKSYGGGGNGNQQTLNANALHRALVDALVGAQSYKIWGAQKEGGGDTLIEPEARFPFVLDFFRAQLRNV